MLNRLDGTPSRGKPVLTAYRLDGTPSRGKPVLTAYRLDGTPSRSNVFKMKT